MKKVNILGVGISKITEREALETVGNWLSHHSGPKFLVTPNPEMLVLAQKDKEFRDILNRADMAVPDGTGLVWASKLVGKTETLYERVSGIDLVLSLCALSAQKGYTIGLLGGREGVAEKTKEVLEKRFSGIKIVFSVSGISPSRSPCGHLEGVQRCDLLFVAFGAPKQENFLWNQIKYQNSGVNPRHYQRQSALDRGNTQTITQTNADKIVINFRVGMGVGGSFDFISGKIKRAPKILQNLGLEWLWRVICEPKRIKRIWTATVVFPWLVFKIHLKKAI